MDKGKYSQKEEKVLKFWKENDVFNKSVQQREGEELFSFYDGPPFATGNPHYGHLLPSALKDATLRYWTMKGYHVPRRVGWDCHGLPVENLAEEELGINTKKEIEELGIEKFSQECRGLVFRYLTNFEDLLKRFGRWADYENYYSTINPHYTESVWWVFKQLQKQGLVYKDYRITPYCPRCGTPLSNFELNQPGAYQDTEDTSVYLKITLKNDPDTKLLVWTTTPWTLPANSTIAVNPEASYVKVSHQDNYYILTETQLDILDGGYEVEKKMTGEDLIGLEYEPLYTLKDYPQDTYKVLGADFVSIEDGSGLVHIAPSFGEDDMKVGREHDLVFKVTVDKTGCLKEDLNIPGAGKEVWEANEDVLKDLEERDLLYKTESINHPYPYCWRCDTRLIYYPLDSWYIAVKDIKDNLIENNKKIHWVPNHLKEGRFGKWLEGARDWSVSRNRYWGAPLPVWVNEDDERVYIGSREDLYQQTFTTNNYWLMRHGEAESNAQGVHSSALDKFPVTKKGKKEIKKQVSKLKDIDLIVSSDVLRAKQTAEILSKKLEVEVVYKKGLREKDFGELEGQPREEYDDLFNNPAEKLSKSPRGMESGREMKVRAYNALKEIDKEYKDKNILIVAHNGILRYLQMAVEGLYEEEYLEKYDEFNMETGEVREIDFKIFPYNRKGKIDFHRPFIDEVKFLDKNGKVMERIPEVFDCWFESGSMPYAQYHYPQEDQETAPNRFPADFITEGMDQTRGWFYTLHVLASALTDKDIGFGKNQPAYKNVIAHGLILGKGGKKLSKHLKNYTSPNKMINQYGADALRFFFLSSAALGTNYQISDKEVKEVLTKIISTLWNCYKFYDTYKYENLKKEELKPQNNLDRWMLSRLNRANKEVSNYMAEYQLDEASRVFIDLIDDLSNWYLRRSRSRLQSKFSSEKEQISTFLGSVLLKIAKMMAPFTPFVTENIYRGLTEDMGETPISVHLCDYPEPEEDLINDELEAEMKAARQVASLGLRARSQAALKVRQPVQEIKVKGVSLKNKELLEMIKEELNIREISFDWEFEDKEEWKIVEDKGVSLALDERLTLKLKKEGYQRELIHAIQMMRKDAGLKPQHRIVIRYSGDEMLEEILQNQKEDFLKANRADNIKEGLGGKNWLVDKEKEIDGHKIKLEIYKSD